MQTAQVLQHYSLSSSSHLRSILLDRSIDAKNYELHCLERHVDLEIAPEMMNQGEGGREGFGFQSLCVPSPFLFGDGNGSMQRTSNFRRAGSFAKVAYLQNATGREAGIHVCILAPRVTETPTQSHIFCSRYFFFDVTVTGLCI